MARRMIGGARRHHVCRIARLSAVFRLPDIACNVAGARPDLWALQRAQSIHSAAGY